MTAQQRALLEQLRTILRETGPEGMNTLAIAWALYKTHRTPVVSALNAKLFRLWNRGLLLHGEQFRYLAGDNSNKHVWALPDVDKPTPEATH